MPNRYIGTHRQILHDLERFYIERIEHYQMLELLADAYRHELAQVRQVLAQRA